MALADLSIRRPVFAWMLMAALILFGAVGFQGLGISQLPDVDFPVVAVNLTYEGAAPDVMESSVVDPIEDAVTSIEGVRKVISQSLQGLATITIEFELNRDVDLALQDVQSKIEQARRYLPNDIDPPIVTKTNPDDSPIMWLALSSKTHSVPALSTYVKNTLKNRFASVSGVGDIRMGGYQEPNLRVWVDPAKLQKLELTVPDVVNAIRQEHSEPPSGYVDTGSKEFNLRMLGEASSVKDFDHMYINSRGGGPNFSPVPLTKVTRIEEGLADIRSIARSNGEPALGLGIQKQRGANAVAVSKGVRARLQEVLKELPKGMKLEVRNDNTRFIEDAVHELNLTLLLSALLTALVCWLFLGSWTATLNVLLAIPTSIIGAFIALYFLGFTLNTFTLLALSLAIGIVVDDSIMVLENIVRRREQLKEGQVEAALLGAREITFAATAATVSILAIFLPVAFMKGIIGRFFLQFGLTLSFAVVLSLIEALTITPARCSQFLKVGPRRTRIGRGIEHGFEALKKGYARLLVPVLNHRWKVMAGAMVIFLASLVSVSFLRREFLPVEDQGQFLLRVKHPIGTSLGASARSLAEIEDGLLKRSEVEGTFAVAGGFGGGQVNTGMLFVRMKRKGERGVDPKLGHEASQSDLMQLCRQQFSKGKDRLVFAQDLASRGFSASRGFPVEFTVKGPDFVKLGEHTHEVMKKMRDSGLVTDVDTDNEDPAPEVRIIPDRLAAEKRGVPVTSITDTVSAALGGVVAGRYTRDGHRFDIRVKMIEDQKKSAEQRVAGLWVGNNRGLVEPLRNVVKIEHRDAAPIITRLNRQRAITVFANVASGKSQSDALALATRLGTELPAGYSLEISGSAQTFQESFTSLIIAFILGLAVAYMVLATQFNSFSDPLTVLSALPFSLAGAFLLLLATGQTINIYSMIGLLLLMGIVKKNSILLVDFTNQSRDQQGLGIRDGLLHACPLRLRPILMTSIASVAGAIPAAIAFGQGAESRQPMAIAVIGGVTLSTALTLIVVPCIYSVLSSRTRKMHEREMRIRVIEQHVEEAEEAQLAEEDQRRAA